MNGRVGSRSGRFVVVAAAFLTAAPALCEEPRKEPYAVQVGDRVRLGLEGEKKVGIVESLDSRTLTLRESSDNVSTLNLDSVLKLEISRGRASRGKHAGRGALIGGIAGALAGSVAASCVSQSSDECGGAWIPIGAAVIGGAGAITGLMIGAAVPPGESWRPAQIQPQRFQARLAPTRGGAKVQVSIAF